MKCHECGATYDNIMAHWQRGQCSIPDINERQKSILEGLLLFGGSFNSPKGRHTRLEFGGISEEFADKLKQKLGWVFTSYSKFKDKKLVRTKSLEAFDKWENRWRTENNERKIPDDFNINPTILRVAFANSGYMNSHDKPEIMFGKVKYTNEDIEEIFGKFNYRISRDNFTINKDNWSMKDTEIQRESVVIRNPNNFFEYIGFEPLLDDKWPNNDIGKDLHCVGCGFPLDNNIRYCSDDCRESEQSNMVCTICGMQISDREKNFHHVSYIPEEGITVCKSCHAGIHMKPGFCDCLKPDMSREDAENITDLSGFGKGGNNKERPPEKSLEELETVDIKPDVVLSEAFNMQ